MANVIYRGSVAKQPETIDLPVTGALLPGTFVKSTGSALVQVTTAEGGRNLLLTNRDYYNQTVTDAYVSGETGGAYRLEPELELQAAMAAATYTFGQELTIAAAGRLAAATTGDLVVAFFDQTGAAITAGTLCDIVIANSYIKS